MTSPVVRRLLWALLVSGAGAAVASAQSVFYWVDQGVDSNAENPANWIDESTGLQSAPVGDGTETLVFGSVAQTKVNFLDSMDVENVSVIGTLDKGSFEFDAPSSQVLTIESTFYAPYSASGYNSVYMNPRLVIGIPNYTTFEVGTYLEIAGTIQGNGLVDFEPANQAGEVILDGSNTYAGGTIIGPGETVLASGGSASAFSSGPITINSGSIGSAGGAATISNAITVNGSAGFIGTTGGSPTFTGTLTVANDATLTFFGANPSDPFYVNGTVTGGSDPIAVYGNGVPVIFSGSNSMAGITAFGNAVLIAANANAFVGTISASSNGYVGTTLTDSTDVNAFLGQVSPTDFLGTIGFDTVPGDYQTPITSTIDLSGLSTSVRLGTATQATISGSILLPSSAKAYNFGNGGGLLDVTTNLADGTSSLGLNVTSSVLQPLTLVLDGANSYTGTTVIDGSALIFDSSGALSPSTSITGSGYVGTTQANSTQQGASGLAAFLGQISTTGWTGIIGFDSTGSGMVTAPINLSAFPVGTFLGSATEDTLAGTITTPDGNYYFTGVKNGILAVQSLLSGSTANVTIGDSSAPGYTDALASAIYSSGGPTIYLENGSNSYGGTTSLYNTNLIAFAGALGSSAVSVNGVSALSAATGGVTFSNNVSLAGGATLVLGANGLGATFSGAFTSATPSSPNTIAQEGGTVIFTAANTVTGTYNLDGGTLNVENDNAFQNMVVNLSDATTVNFTTANPTVGGIGDDDESLGTANLTLENNAVLTIDTQSGTNISYSGSITGYNVEILKTGPGFQDFDGTNNITGVSQIDIQQGGVAVNQNSSLGTASILVYAGGFFGLAPHAVFTNQVTFTGTTVNPGFMGGFGTYAPVSAAMTIGNGTAVGGGALLFGPTVVAPATGTLSLGSSGTPIAVTLAGGGTIDFGLQTPASGTPIAGNGWSLIAVTGTTSVTANAETPFVINLYSFDASGAVNPATGFNASQAYTWSLLTSTAGISGFNANAFSINTTDFANSLGSGQFSLSETGDEIDLNFTPVPEPGTYALMGVGLGLLAWPLWSRRRLSLARARR